MEKDSKGVARRSIDIKITVLVLLALFSYGCTVWRTAPFDVNVKNSSVDSHEIIFNDQKEGKVSESGSTNRYVFYSKAEGTDWNYYGTGPTEPERTTVYFTARNLRTGELSKTIALQLRQDETTFVEITKLGIPIWLSVIE